MRTFSSCVFIWFLLLNATGVLMAQDFAKLSEVDRKQVNDWLAERAETMVVAHKLAGEISQAWSNDKFSSPEVEALRKRYRELQQELVRTQLELQKKVQEVPAFVEKQRQLDAANRSVQELTKKVSEKSGGEK